MVNTCLAPLTTHPALPCQLSSGQQQRRYLPLATEGGDTAELPPPPCWCGQARAQLLCGCCWCPALPRLPAQSLHTIQPKTSCTAQLRPINLYSLSPQLKCTHRENFIYRLFQGPFNPLISEIYTQLECFRNGGRDMRWRSEVSTGGHQ